MVWREAVPGPPDRFRPPVEAGGVPTKNPSAYGRNQLCALFWVRVTRASCELQAFSAELVFNSSHVMSRVTRLECRGQDASLVPRHRYPCPIKTMDSLACLLVETAGVNLVRNVICARRPTSSIFITRVPV